MPPPWMHIPPLGLVYQGASLACQGFSDANAQGSHWICRHEPGFCPLCGVHETKIDQIGEVRTLRSLYCIGALLEFLFFGLSIDRILPPR